MNIGGVAAILAMLVCLFGPTTLFAIVGIKSMDALGKRPSKGGRVMTVLVTKLIAGGGVAIGIMMGVLFLVPKK